MAHVWVTGFGICGSTGPSAEASWALLGQGTPLPLSEGAEGFSRTEACSHAAVQEALAQSGIDDVRAAGCTFSASKPLRDGPTWKAPHVLSESVRRRFGFAGESRTVIAACATGAYAIALGASWIEQGVCDVVVAGSAEAPPHALMEAGFRNMGVLSREVVMRPFDRRRSGFVFGEGAAALVIESESHAQKRRATPLARLSGWALGADAHDRVSFNSNGARMAAVLKSALSRAQLSPRDIGHVNAHATATRLNDFLEAQALRQVFGSQLETAGVAATKSSTGHWLGAAGSLEAVLTIQALRAQEIPRTWHGDEPDSECAVPLLSGPRDFAHAASLSFGFGGSIGVLVFSAC